MRALILAALAVIAAPAAAAPAPIAGRWLTEEGKAIVEIGACGADLCGRIVRVLKPRPGGPAVDAKNPDAALRNRPIQGIQILTAFKPDGDRWRGRIYDPESGKSYRSEVRRAGNMLSVKGCIGPFCRGQEWKALR